MCRKTGSGGSVDVSSHGELGMGNTDVLPVAETYCCSRDLMLTACGWAET